jgi:hypothetical protein
VYPGVRTGILRAESGVKSWRQPGIECRNALQRFAVGEPKRPKIWRSEMAEVIPYVVLVLTGIVPFALILVGISGE